MLAVILLAPKHTYPLKIILQSRVLRLTGNMLLKDNGCFIKYGEGFYTIRLHPMKYSRQNLNADTVRMGTICWRLFPWPGLFLCDWRLLLILHGIFHCIVKAL